jgi:hypothetical protein
MKMMDQPGIRTIDIFRLAGAIIRDNEQAPAEQPPASMVPAWQERLGIAYLPPSHVFDIVFT